MPLPQILRKRIRLQGYDYSQAGTYFITISTANYKCILSKICDQQVTLLPIGSIVNKCLSEIKQYYPQIEVNQYVIMPNHLHVLLYLNDISMKSGLSSAGTIGEYGTGRREYGTGRREPAINESSRGRKHLYQIIGTFKAAATQLCRKQKLLKGEELLWMRSFYDRIVRNDKEFTKFSQYILTNPLCWELDHLYPHWRF